jgi:hypothetical protein
VSGTEIKCVLRKVEIFQPLGTVLVAESNFSLISETAEKAPWPKKTSHSGYP